MREKKTHLYLDSQERRLLLHSLVELKNQLIQQGRYTDCVDELIFKVTSAPLKRNAAQAACQSRDGGIAEITCKKLIVIGGQSRYGLSSFYILLLLQIITRKKSLKNNAIR